MTSRNPLPHWVERKENELREMEWDWRVLDEQERSEHHTHVPGWLDLAKQVKEVEASRIRAELAVGNFVAQAGSDLVASSDKVAQSVEDHAECAALPDSELQWGSPTSTVDPATREFSVDLEAMCLLSGQEKTRQLYRFHVIGDRVNAWRALPKAS